MYSKVCAESVSPLCPQDSHVGSGSPWRESDGRKQSVVSLLTASVKLDDEERLMRFAFRIVSPQVTAAAWQAAAPVLHLWNGQASGNAAGSASCSVAGRMKVWKEG
jgi:hypothetical protein